MNTCQPSYKRRNALKGRLDLNGIDYIEVEDLSDSGLSGIEKEEYDRLPPAHRERLLWQRRLKVHFINNLVGDFQPGSITIEGGERIRNITVLDARPDPAAAKVLVVVVNQAGDFSDYTLRITPNAGDQQLDPLFSALKFSFKMNCPSEFDCRSRAFVQPTQFPEPHLDYLAKDYTSFRQLMLDRMSLAMPDWKERHAADLGVVLVELLAYMGDRLSYRQDAVATEAYLGIARKRISVRRHARMLDYRMHDGCNARVLVQIKTKETGDGCRLPGSDRDGLFGSRLATTIPKEKTVLTGDELAVASASGSPAVFETMHDLTLYNSHNEINFYTWGEDEALLPQGATCAVLEDPPENRLRLRPGDLLIFEQKGLAIGDVPRRHAVRLTTVTPEAKENKDGSRIADAPKRDPLFPEHCYASIEWASEDALPFPICLSRKEEGAYNRKGWRALGNIVLADQGETVCSKIEVTEEAFRPSLPGPLTQQGRLPQAPNARPVPAFDPTASLASVFTQDVRSARPVIRLVNEVLPDAIWYPRPDLLGSDRFAREFVVEIEEDEIAFLRFGDGRTMGLKPELSTKFAAQYRLGNGTEGNVGAGTITHLIADPGLHLDDVVEKIGNPLPACGGREPESIAEVQQYAPQAFRSQQRAVNADDYAMIAQRPPQVQKAAATIRWTGSWYTVFVSVDRLGSRPADDPGFLGEVKRFLQWYRMAGYDIEVSAPQFVPVDLALQVMVQPEYFADVVKQALLEVFSNRDLADGRRGFFHPDNLTFGQPLYLSGIYATAMAVDGVASVKVIRLQRWGKGANNELAKGYLPTGKLEIIQLENDPNFPERGVLKVQVQSP